MGRYVPPQLATKKRSRSGSGGATSRDHRAARRYTQPGGFFVGCCSILDRYLQQQARQDMRRHVAGVFVAYEAESTTVAGYYTLSATSIELADLLQDMAKRLPRRPTLPAVLLGRLAVDQRYRGQRVGELLLMSALRRSARLRTDIGMIAVIVDAKDDRARSFYERYGFMRLEEQEFRLFLPMKTIDQLFVD